MEGQSGEIATDFYGNKLSVTAIGGDANLEQIADITLLIDAFFSGAPAPKGLFGYVDDLARDVLEDLKRDYYEEIDALQDALAYAYEDGFKLQLLLAGINPDSHQFQIQFAERMTDSKNQRADLALKYQALGMPRKLAWEAAGVDVQRAEAMREDEANSKDPYPENHDIDDKDDKPQHKVSITQTISRKAKAQPLSVTGNTHGRQSTHTSPGNDSPSDAGRAASNQRVRCCSHARVSQAISGGTG
uniref:hypothetical protein n=1 Tax=Vibrio cholerae TaxID=666 RepID=UPI003F58730D